MINLLPSPVLDNVSYARRNTQLRNWSLAILGGIVGVGIIVGTGRLIIDRSSARVSNQVTAAQEQLKIQKVDEVQDRVEDVSDSLKLATEVLSRQVVLSSLIQQIATVLPGGTALSGLELSKIEGGIDLSVIADDYESATQVQINLSDPENKLFKQADIVNISCSGSLDPRYPCLATFRVLFTDENPYTLLEQDN